MFQTTKEEQLRDLHIDNFINSVSLTSTGGYAPSNYNSTALEAEKQTVENRLKAEVAQESSKKK